MLHLRRLVAVLFVVVLAVPAVSALAADKGGSPNLTLKGEVLDMACYLGHGAKGPEHQKCALRCAEMGQPIGLLADDGKVYLLVADHTDQSAFEAAKKLAGQQVTIQGTVAARDGISALTVHEIKKA